jgi:hypothetical protein
MCVHIVHMEEAWPLNKARLIMPAVDTHQHPAHNYYTQPPVIISNYMRRECLKSFLIWRSYTSSSKLSQKIFGCIFSIFGHINPGSVSGFTWNAGSRSRFSKSGSTTNTDLFFGSKVYIHDMCVCIVHMEEPWPLNKARLIMPAVDTHQHPAHNYYTQPPVIISNYCTCVEKVWIVSSFGIAIRQAQNSACTKQHAIKIEFS